MTRIVNSKDLKKGLNLKVSPHFIDSADVKPIRPRGFPKGHVTPLLVTPKMLLLEVFREKGQIDRPHRHEDHDTVTYFVKGKLKVTLGEKEYVAKEGCAWYHPAGLEHSNIALEECLQIEIKYPLQKTWTE